jgi:hypothetical protein
LFNKRIALILLITGCVTSSAAGPPPARPVVVAVQGTPEAKHADFVCDGVDDHIEINAAIARAVSPAPGRPRNGIVQMAAGTYSVAQPVAVFEDGVTLQGVAGRTIIQAAPKFALPSIDGVFVPAVITFIGVKDFAVRRITVDSSTHRIATNGIAIISDGPDHTGSPSTNGIIEENRVLTTPAHAYAIWNVFGNHIVIRNNLVDGGSTDKANSQNQEGIEILYGNDVLIANNTIRNIGNAAINVSGIHDVTPGDSDFVRILNNTIEDSRTGVNLGAVIYPDDNKGLTRHCVGVQVIGNTLRRVSEFGIVARSYYGKRATPLFIKDILISGNRIELRDVNPEAPGNVPGARVPGVLVMAGPALYRTEPEPGGTEFANIVVTGNDIRAVSGPPSMGTSPLADWIWTGGPRWPARIVFSGASGFTLRDNTVDAGGTAALYVHRSGPFTLGPNTFGGAPAIVEGIVPMTLERLGFASQQDVRRASSFSSHGAVLALGSNEQLLFLGKSLRELDATHFSFRGPSSARALLPLDSRQGRNLSGDFDGDGRDELLWRDLYGRMYSTTLRPDNTYAVGAVKGLAQSFDWRVAGVGDFDNDGHADILWQRSDGRLSVWHQGLKSAEVHLRKMPGGSGVLGTGDFDGNGSSDILIQKRATGALAVRWSDKGKYSESSIGVPPDRSAELVAIGDFDGNGADDLAWISLAGQLSISRITNRKIVAAHGAGDPLGEWTVVGAGDTDGDGLSDILLWHPTGRAAVRLMRSDLSFVAANIEPGVNEPKYYYLAGIGDANGDGKADLTWLHTAGVLATWPLNGSTHAGFSSGPWVPLSVLQ